MPRRPPLHSADELLAPAIDRAIAAVGPPADDDGLVALARLLAKTLDRMTNAERTAMLGQTAPQLLRVLVELDKRAARRHKPVRREPNQLDRLREAHARTLPRGHN
jgi:hypothetical protein